MSTKKSLTPRWLYLDALRVWAAFAVVLLHTASFVMVDPFFSFTQWLAANFFNSLSRWCVPVFIMISGALFLRLKPPLNVKNFWRVRISRLLLPTLFWSAVYFSWWFLTGHKVFSWHLIGYTLLFDQPFEHLYFLFLIAELYVLTPGLLWLWQRSSLSGRWLLGMFWFLLAWVWPPKRFVLLLWVPFVCYYWLGGLLAHHQLSSSQIKKLSLIFLAAVVWIALGTYVLTFVTHATRNLALFDFSHPLVAVSAASLFLSIQSIRNSSKQLLLPPVLIQRLAPLTFGIYLLHPLVIWGMGDIFKVGSSWLSMWIMIPIFTSTVFMSCALIVSLLKKFPGLQKIV